MVWEPVALEPAVWSFLLASVDAVNAASKTNVVNKHFLLEIISAIE